MATRITHDLTYDAPAGAVLAMLSDPAFREEVCERMAVTRATVRVEETDAETTVTVEQEQPSEGLPSFATALVGESIPIVRVERWTDPTRADVEVTIPGKPGEMVGTATLTESGGTTTERVELEIRVRIPLVAGRIEKLVAEMLLKALRTENETGRDYLSR
ncbi:DUF2505 domain-containing protein [Nocardioides pantholopis]|uniref:DUF2505 domain-containing protein n=1 Tax=Nocardioides pantholopis TaxID=2483798 RepID=UPI0013DDEEB7|nr:DUF2505 domain-containing protein [Nocardioides pantholopis]